ncbi:MAG: gamma-glutamylcyclotransferase [Ardenticatenales bacterium]|nr:gamma-glutamylcyclotransferase [Ardenticatenales bacterium]
MALADMLPFFTYGTLRPGERNHALIESVVSSAQAALVEGVELWNLGRFPMAVEGTGQVVGDLLHIHPEHYETILALLDELEGVNPAAPTQPGGLYWRARYQVQLHGSGLAEAWIYLGEQARASRGKRIPGGDWKQRSS